MLQSMTLFTEPSAPRRFGLALRGSLNSVNVACAVLFARYNEVSQWNQLVQEERLLIIIELAAAALAGALGLLLPRRPDVFHKGVVVDRQATSSVFGLLFFSWSRSSLHVLSTTTSPLICCLPELNYRTRALHLLQQFRQHDSLQSHRYPLWRMVLGIYSRKLVVQLTLTILGSTISFAPQMMLLGILRAMERDSDRESRLSTTAPWIFGLGTSLIMTALVDKWTVWVSSIDLGLKMQKQLTMLLFDKMLRGTSTKPEEEDNDNDSEATNPASLNLINLVAVDTQQIGNCIREIYRGYESLIKLIISGYLIQQLMGWRSLVASFVMIVLLFGANALVARQLARGQNTLMADKDLRVSAVTEALLGVRRIKLSGAEDDWAKYISVQRGKELASLWAVNRWSMTSKAICTLTPIVLSVLVISIHVHATGSLKASTAFTALSILGSINGTLAAIPSLQSSWVRASNSLGRLQDYLYAADQCFPSTNHDEISFRNATVRWNGSGPTGFALKDLTLSFPPGSVSVIEGPNRSGKSLLLAAILGECELVCGNVTKPSLVAQTRAVTGGRPWPLNVAIAYVGQTPWIEAGTIMQNITFGLPMHARRYKKVLHACALETDLATFKDGDWTEIGPHGVNLSGGQRSRIALARALYSSATTLVLDDIFSAVDAHTALHMAEHVLSGSLIQGRTVILASHHPSLYMPGANFIVSLSGDGQYQCRYAEDRYQDESQDTYNTTKRMTPKERSGSSSKARSRHSRNLSTFSVASGELFVIPDSTGVMTTHQYIADEQEQNSGLQHSTLTLYLRHIGSYWYTLLIVLIYASYVGIVVGQVCLTSSIRAIL
jgi:ABC-type multidrug transport system fused ATPase/permease subunit